MFEVFCVGRKLSDYIEDIKLELTGGVLELEISDEAIAMAVKRVFGELQRYIDETRLIEVPFARCIDLSGFKYKNIVAVYRTSAVGDVPPDSSSFTDPLYAQIWMTFGNGVNMYNLNNYLLNYMSYNTLLQTRNTISTDLAFKEDRDNKRLYINVSAGFPDKVAIEYVPLYDDVSELQSEYWQDILLRMSTAYVKVVLGNIRTRFVQSNALWTQDGASMREEGNAELSAIRETLRTNSNMIYPVD